ncbi:class I tRNA ligase family protein, partial [Candidatus Calescamantes bacterium]|nr:class I tRNA ligase family protein [Candidatus Calescamantes bacterium]
WWGHRIPVFYCDECDEKWVSKEVPQECPKCGSSDIRQDEDVLDTWFSSALWPFSTMGWPEKTELLSEYYPTSVLITDRGIIFNWVARMIMMGLKFMDKKPFFDVYIHGTILDEIGRKMSKSLGNGIDPIEMADKYGADAVRFSLISLTTFGQDISLSENKFQMGRNFSNKIWNAMRFILMNINESVEYVDEFDQRTPFDKWIYSRFSQAAKKMKAALDEYNFSEYADTLYHFFWDEFCDWYIEASKKNLDKKETLQNLLYIAKRFLIYLNPAMPVLSEVLYDYLPKSFRSDTGIMDEPVFMPKKDDIDISGEELMASILEWITAVRRSRKEFNIKPSSELKVILQTDKKTEGLMFLMKEELTTFVKASALDFTMTEKPGSSINVIIKGITSYIPAQGLIDIEKERSRLKDQRAEVDKFISMSENKLSNKNFVSKAPKSVVEGVRETLKSNQELLKRIEENLESIQ